MNKGETTEKKRPVRTGKVRKCFWFAEQKSVAPDTSSIPEGFIEVNLSGLPKDKRRPVWDWIQANMPELAQMIGTDPQFLEIKAAFDCAVKVELPTSACRELGLLR